MHAYRLQSAMALLALGAASSFAGGASATTIGSWNVGSGQYQDNFQFSEDLGFEGGELELGLRAVFRQSATRVTVTGDVYSVLPGHQQAGVAGAPVTAPDRAMWNFDYHIYYAGGVQNLDSLTLTITTPAGNTVTTTPDGVGVFDMKLANNDNLPGNSGSDDDNDPAYYIQDSQNPVFFPWFESPFDMNVVGDYTFTLTATRGASTLTETMTVSVVPEPASLALVALGGALVLVRRSKA